jgi:hypothetical protein
MAAGQTRPRRRARAECHQVSARLPTRHARGVRYMARTLRTARPTSERAGFFKPCVNRRT